MTTQTATTTTTPEDIQARGYFRRLQLRKIVYEDAPVMGGDEAHDKDTHHYSVRFMAGHHCPEGMTYFGTMEPSATATLSTLANAMKQLQSGAKESLRKPKGAAATAPLRLCDANLHFRVTTVLEAIPSEPDPKNNNKRVCAGYAFHWNLREVNATPPTAGALLNDDPPQDADSNDGAGAPGAAAAAAEPGARGKKAKETRAKMLARIKEVARRNPLAYGISRSCAEAKEINDTVKLRRDKYVQTYKTKKGELPAMAEARLKIRNAPTTEQYQFAAFETMEQFLFGEYGIQSFYRPKPGCNRAIPDDDPGNAFLKLVSGSSALDETNETIAKELRGTGLPPADYYGCPLSPLNPDHIFSLERSLVYMMRDGSYRVSAKSCSLREYIPGANSNPTAVHNHPQGRHGPPIIRNLGRTNGDDDDDDEDDNEEDEDDGIPSLRYMLVDGTGEPYFSTRSARPYYPYPRLTWVLNRQASYAEMLGSVIQAPIPIGAEIPESAFDAVDFSEARVKSYQPPLESDADMAQMLESIVNLVKTGNINNNTSILAVTTPTPDAAATEPDVLMRRPLSPGTPVHQTPRHGPILAYEYVESTSDPSDTMANLMARGQGGVHPLAKRQAHTQEELKEAERQQINVVRNTLETMVVRFQKRTYDELTATWSHSIEDPPSNTFMPLTEFHPPRNVHDNSNLSQLELARRHLEQIKITNQLSEEEENLVRYYVDIFPTWQLERNEFLQKRGVIQMSRAVMLVQQQAEVKAILLDSTKSEEDKETLLAEADKRHASEKDKWYAQNWKLFDDTFYATERASPALLAVRNYTKVNVYPHRNKTRVKPMWFFARPYIVTRQFYLDTYRTVELVTKQNSIYMERAHVCAHHAFRYMPRREEPSLNLIFVGEAGAGKSFCLKIATTLTPDGVVSDTTSETTASNNVDQDFDGNIVIYQEMDSNLLFSNTNKNDTGATDKINFAKARMTSFFTRTKYFHQDEQTGKRMAAECFSSQHIVTMGATNQKLDDMDKNMKRRLLINYVVEQVVESDGGQVHELVRNNTEASALSTAVPEHTRLDHRELFCAYVYVETAIKMGVQSELLDMGAMTMLNCILKEAHIDKGISIHSKGHRTWILEVARILSIQNACYRGLFSPEAFAVYESRKKVGTSNIERWSPQAFHMYVAPQLWITKDALVHALTMFDFLYCSRDDDRLLATIALRVCQLANPAHWTFRNNCGSDSHNEPRDYNYLSYSAPSVKKILEYIADAHKNIGKYRAEDLRTQMSALERLRRPSFGFRPEFDDVGRPLRLVRQTGGIEVDRPAIIYELDTSSNAKNQPWQFCISIEFLESRFNIDIEKDSPETIIAKMEHSERLLDASLFDPQLRDPTELWETLHEMVKCVDRRAPLVGSVLKVLNSRNLERSPFENETLGLNVPEEMYRYMTFYFPDDVRLRFDDGSSKSIRVPLDGTPMLLHAVREETSNMMLMQDNYTKPLVTAQYSLYQQPAATEQGEKLAAIPEMSKGVVLDAYDVDYHMAFEQMRRLGHPGIPELHNFFVLACIEDRDKRRFPDARDYKARLFEAIPELHPKAGYPLPFAFPPIAFRIERYLARHVHKWIQIINYPACNVDGRLRDTIMRTESRANGNKNGAYEKISERNQYALHRQRAIRNIERARQQPLGPPASPSSNSLRKRFRVIQQEEEEEESEEQPRRKRARIMEPESIPDDDSDDDDDDAMEDVQPVDDDDDAMDIDVRH